VEIRDLDPDQFDAAFDIFVRSFGPVSESRRERWQRTVLEAVTDRRALGCHVGTQLVAMARINRYRQWWHGRTLPMAGIASVVVAPEHRGRGIGTRLIHATLDRAAGLGYPVSALYPETVPPYRNLGWEFAGARYVVRLPTEALRGLATTPVPLRRVGPDQAGEILSVVRRCHTAARSSGPIDWDESDAHAWLAEERPFSHLAEDGFLAYHWEGPDLQVDELVAGSTATALALWSLVGSGSSVANTVRACVGPDDPLRWLTREAVVRPAGQKPWMLRLVDVPAALAGRGYPAGLDAEVDLAVDDPQRPGNTGCWRLTVAAGAGRVAPVTDRPDALRLGPRGVATLYSGTPLATLRVAGLASGGEPAADALLDAIFGGNPYLLDDF
jgi:predicted acetyltransferase